MIKNEKVTPIQPIKIKPIQRKVGRSMDIAKPRPSQPVITPPIKKNNEEVVAEAFKQLTDNQSIENSVQKRRSKFINIFTVIVGIIFLLIMGYFVYINIPLLSVRVASAQAGINATYPEYHPDGYSANGPVSYGDGQVTITFYASSGNLEYTINQSKSLWDSSALKEKIQNEAKNNPITTTTERGLTIYSYSGKAYWVNGGILYTITGNANLANDQIRRIATSL